jgi:excisionase family DNA binding protein
MPKFCRIGPDANPLDRLLYGKEEAAALLSLSLRSLNYAIAAGLIRIIRKGRRVLIHRSEITRFSCLNHPYRLRSPRSRWLHKRTSKSGSLRPETGESPESIQPTQPAPDRSATQINEPADEEVSNG